MTSEELYYQFHLLLNKNAQDSNINVSRGNFVLLYNRESRSWLYDFINSDKADDDIININDLKVKNYKLELLKIEENYNVYNLPVDWFNLIYGDCYSYTSTPCRVKLYNRIAKSDDQNEFTRNEFTKPKIEWERGLFDVAENKLFVYKNNFELEDTFISYYKEIPQIDLSGYIKIDGSQSKNIDSNISDWIQERVLDRVVTETMRQFENQLGFQVSKDRQQIK